MRSVVDVHASAFGLDESGPPELGQVVAHGRLGESQGGGEERTADCVVAGFRWHKGSNASAIGSLLLGLYDDDGNLAHVGVSASFTAAKRLLWAACQSGVLP